MSMSDVKQGTGTVELKLGERPWGLNSWLSSFFLLAVNYMITYI